MTKPEDLFRAEKERAVTARNSQHARLLAEAKAAFDKLMAEGQAARKSGRPRKHPLPPLKTTSSRIPPKPPVPEVRPVPVAAAPIRPEPKPVMKSPPRPAVPAKAAPAPKASSEKRVAKAPKAPARGKAGPKPKAKSTKRR